MTQAVEPLALTIDSEEFVALLGVSWATFNRMKRDGLLPQHATLTPRTHRWIRTEVLAWIAAGCLPREAWEQMKAQRAAN